jgi:hypothetical protein
MYQEFNVSLMSQVPGVITGFATSNGITLPATISYVEGGTNAQNKRVHATRSGDDGAYAFIEAPRLNGTVAAAISTPPTKVHCIGGTTPVHWMCAIVEFGYNLYRHLYLGNMEKLGNYTGGEVISASNFATHQASPNSPSYSISYVDNQSLFNAIQSFAPNVVVGGNTVSSAGGVKVTHADNPISFRKFRHSNIGSTPTTNFIGDEVFGGYGDSVNDGMLARAKSSFAGAAILVPINLYVSRTPAGVDVRFTPIGRPSGARLVRMDGLDPGSQIEVGNKLWRVWPMIRKSTSKTVGKGTAWPADETSYLVGMAYLED